MTGRADLSITRLPRPREVSTDPPRASSPRASPRLPSTDGPTRMPIPEIHLRAAPPSTGTPPGEREAAHTPFHSRPGPGPLTNPTTRLRPRARLRLGCAPPRGPPSGTATGPNINVSRTIHRHPTHFPADLQTVTIRWLDSLSIGDLWRPRSHAPATARKTQIMDRKQITILPHHCADVACR